MFPTEVHLLLISYYVGFRFLSEYRFDVSKLEPVVAKVGDLDCPNSYISAYVYLFSLLNFSFLFFLPFFRFFFVFENLQPHSPDNRALARECKDVKIDRVYVGSCTGGKTEDFLALAKVFVAAVITSTLLLVN